MRVTTGEASDSNDINLLKLASKSSNYDAHNLNLYKYTKISLIFILNAQNKLWLHSCLLYPVSFR